MYSSAMCVVYLFVSAHLIVVACVWIGLQRNSHFFFPLVVSNVFCHSFTQYNVNVYGDPSLIAFSYFQVCDVNQMWLPVMRLLIALYTSFFGMLAVLANAGWLVLRVRRSVEEVFNFFVCFFFIFKSLKSLFEVGCTSFL